MHGRLPLLALLRPLERHLWRPFAELQLGGFRVYPVLFYLSLAWTIACIAVLEVRAAQCCLTRRASARHTLTRAPCSPDRSATSCAPRLYPSTPAAPFCHQTPSGAGRRKQWVAPPSPTTQRGRRAVPLWAVAMVPGEVEMQRT